MADDKIYVTQEGLEELKKEQENLIHVVRQEVIEDLKAARAQGDLSENADYDAARDRQAQVEARIRELEVMLNNIEIIDDKQGSVRVAKIGSTVKIEELDTHQIDEFTIVGSVEADRSTASCPTSRRWRKRFWNIKLVRSLKFWSMSRIR